MAAAPQSLYIAAPWPSGDGIGTQKDVAKYIVQGRAAYDSCVANLDALKSMREPQNNKAGFFDWF